MVIMGIDPGSRITGYGLIEVSGNHYRYVDSGVVNVTKLTSAHHRLQTIFMRLQEVAQQYQPAEVALEQVFVHHNPAGSLKLGQARGVAMVACAPLDTEVHEYSARQVKQGVVGYGAADKAQVQHMVMRLLNLQVCPKEDEADGLAVALAHANHRAGSARYKALTEKG